MIIEKELINSLPFNQMMEQKIWTPDQKLLALSWKQPYAELMLHGKIETRTWNTNYRGWVLICASKKGYSEISVLDISGNMFSDIEIKCGHKWEYCLFGYAIAIGYLSDCRPMQLADEDKCFVKYYIPGLFCHIYQNVQAIEPFLWKGSQGWKEVTHEIKKQIRIIEP
jgi:hypothetical protein